MSALDRISASAREILKCGDRDGNRLVAAEAELIAAHLAETGLQGGRTLDWMASLIRFRLGVGKRPSELPASTAMEQYTAQLAQQRADLIVNMALDARKAAA